MTVYLDGKTYTDEAQLEAVNNPALKAAGINITPVSEQPSEPTGALKSQSSNTPSQGNNVSTGSTTAPEPNPDRSVLDKLLGIDGPRYKTWPERAIDNMVSGAVGGLTLPHDVYEGKVNPESDEGIQRAADLAGTMVFGPAPVASKMADGTLGSFAGVTSATADKGALDVAQAAAAEGVGADEIWKKTGWLQGPEGKWRYEIDDSGAKVKPFQADSGMLFELLDHPDLYEAYPSLKFMKVNLDPNLHPDAAANYYKHIDFGTNAIKDKSTILHEVQHSIQDLEGFAQGGAPGKLGVNFELKHRDAVRGLAQEYLSLRKKTTPLSAEEQERVKHLDNILNTYLKYEEAARKQARDNYLALAGEVESRNVSTRADLSPLERMYHHPLDTEDTPRQDQFVTPIPVATSAYDIGLPKGLVPKR